MYETGRRRALAAPPRMVPLLVSCRLLFGGVLNQAGWLFFGFGLIFFWAFAVNSDPIEWLDFRGEMRTVQGAITTIQDTSASEGGSSITAYHYAFEVDGVAFDGVSYDSSALASPGEGIPIQYPVGRPHRSRITGMRTAMFSPAVLFVTIFPVVGLVLALIGFVGGMRNVRLLAHGELGMGTLKSKRKTATQVNRQRVYELTFEFTDDRGRTREVTARTFDTAALEDNAEEPLLFDPFRRGSATMLDHLPGRPRIDEHGEIQSGNSVVALAAMLLPLVTLAGHGLFVYKAYLIG